MNLDTERYKICLECVYEDQRRRTGYSPADAEISDYAIGLIEKAILKGDKWQNPYGPAIPFDKPCSWCIYVLEHIVLSEKLRD